jgi:CRP-like cAMP-binding protein
VNFFPDIRYYREIKSPLLPLARELCPFGPPAEFDLTRYARFVAGACSVETDVSAIWDDLQRNLLGAHRVSLFDGLTHDDVRKLIVKGCTLETSPGQVVTRAELVEREIFVVLDGLFEESAPDGRQLAVLTTGDPLGELSLFLPTGRRTTSINSLTAGKLLVLGARFLPTLAASDPSVAVQLLHNFGRVVATRLAGMIESPV